DRFQSHFGTKCRIITFSHVDHFTIPPFLSYGRSLLHLIALSIFWGVSQIIRLFLINLVMGSLLAQRGEFVLNACSVMNENKAFVFCGKSGVGKSTFAAALCKYGFKLLTDEISVVKLNHDKKPYVISSGPYIQLWNDALNVLNFDNFKKKRIRPCIDKYYLDFNYFFSEGICKIDRIYIISIHNKNKIEISNISGINKIIFVRDHLFKATYTPTMIKNQIQFIDKICQNTEITLLKRPMGISNLKDNLMILSKDFI
ncbi:MAG: hypothetical protein J7L72_11430, partial [Candidatus Aminicenantes bacterium]|nr:hypothetical protein [Candidatus Aminicenantes bacterium]